VAVPPTIVPASAVTVEVVFTIAPIAVALTFTEKVHETPGFSVAPVRLMTFVPAVAVIGPPPHEPVKPLGVDITSPLGNVSVKAMPPSGIGFAAGFVMVKAKAVVFAPNNCNADWANALEIVGGSTTVKVSVAGPPGGASFEVSVRLVFKSTDGTVPTTFTLIVHDVLAATVPSARLMLPDPATAVSPAVTAAPQLVLKPLGVATYTCAGSASLKATPVSIKAFVLLIVKVRVDVAPTWIVDGENAFVNPGATATGAGVRLPPVTGSSTPPKFEAFVELILNPPPA